MSTTTQSTTSDAAAGEARILVAGVPWDFYARFVDGLPAWSRVRAAYDGRDMEIMVKGPMHEDFRGLLGRFVEEVAAESGLRFLGLGETTWNRRDVERGLESDQCYYFDPDKIATAKAALKRKDNDVAGYPNPDLAIEVDISPSLVDRPAIYAALRVPEIWRFDGEALRIERLTDAGVYALVDRSGWLAVDPSEVLEWITADDAQDRGAWAIRLREWGRARGRVPEN
ncbi:MAG: Uma2 family endonuclease [Paludisphaera borealis]|uniref:Uma2 family endonuclease n=1 Tax=Paludisphaera borealis TaxID=1387353 RepID=UPI00284DF02E|nr:Uma2 family endonuclease [Paludisphaera borealis]MDR3619666.1 Uma2 family endonuclease [Paludisphaera borealis]